MKRKVAMSTQKKLIFSSGGDLAPCVYVGIHTHTDKCMFVLYMKTQLGDCEIYFANKC